MLQSWSQKSGHLASRKSGPLSSEKLILLSWSRRRALAFSKEVFRRLGNLWIFFKAREKSSNLRSTRRKSQGKKRNGEGKGEKGGGRERRKERGIARVEENGEKEFSASRKNVHCVHARGQLLPPSRPSFSPCHPLSYPYFFRFERRRRNEKREREREKGRTKFRIFADVSPWKDRGVGCSRFPMKGFFSGILHNRPRFSYS